MVTLPEDASGLRYQPPRPSGSSLSGKDTQKGKEKHHRQIDEYAFVSLVGLSGVGVKTGIRRRGKMAGGT
jgi:hypothetical protein